MGIREAQHCQRQVHLFVYSFLDCVERGCFGGVRTSLEQTQEIDLQNDNCG